MEKNFDEINSILPQYIHGVQSYQAGRPIEEVMKERNLSLDSISKLASNENPLGPSPKAIEEMSRSFGDLNRYPEMNGTKLKNLIAKKVGKDSDQIILGNGSEELIAHILKLMVRPNEQILTSENTFIGFLISGRVLGASIIELPMTRDLRFDVSGIINTISEKTKVLYIANPNNPTGTYLTKEEFEKLMKVVPSTCIVIMDEAYTEYAAKYDDYPDALDYLHQYPNLISLRTFSKAYGIAGMRVGYGVGHSTFINHLHKVKLAFAPSVLAQAAAIGAIQDEDYLKRTLTSHDHQYRKTFSYLKRSGLKPVPSAANFICIPVGSEEAAQYLNDQLLNQGVIIRPLKAFGMPDYIRVSIGTEREMNHFMDAMDQVLPDYKMKFMLQVETNLMRKNIFFLTFLIIFSIETKADISDAVEKACKQSFERSEQLTRQRIQLEENKERLDELLKKLDGKKSKIPSERNTIISEMLQLILQDKQNDKEISDLERKLGIYEKLFNLSNLKLKKLGEKGDPKERLALLEDLNLAKLGSQEVKKELKELLLKRIELLRLIGSTRERLKRLEIGLTEILKKIETALKLKYDLTTRESELFVQQLALEREMYAAQKDYGSGSPLSKHMEFTQALRALNISGASGCYKGLSPGIAPSKLSSELLKTPGLQPVKTLKKDGLTFYFSKILKPRKDDHYEMVVMYSKKDGDPKLRARLMYKSNSSGGWRVMPSSSLTLKEGGIASGHFDKGDYYNQRKNHYTQTTKPHEDVANFLFEMEEKGEVALKPPQLENKFNYLCSVHSGDYTIGGEQQHFSSRSLSYITKISPPFFNNESKPKIVDDVIQQINRNILEVKGFMPNMRTDKPVRVYRLNHTLLSKGDRKDIEVTVFKGQLDGRSIEWHFAEDVEGRVWIDRINFVPAKVNSYGLLKEVLDSGYLTSKPLEYNHQAPRLHPKIKKFNDSYVDQSGLLQQLLPIHMYKLWKKKVKKPSYN